MLWDAVLREIYLFAPTPINTFRQVLVNMEPPSHIDVTHPIDIYFPVILVDNLFHNFFGSENSSRVCKLWYHLHSKQTKSYVKSLLSYLNLVTMLISSVSSLSWLLASVCSVTFISQSHCQLTPNRPITEKKSFHLGYRNFWFSVLSLVLISPVWLWY